MQRVALLLPLALAVAGTLGIAGCTTLSEYIHNGFKVGPNYSRPAVPVPPQWIDSDDPKVRVGVANLCDWWNAFDDPILTKLIHDAFASNLTIRAAGFQILQARELRCIAIGELLPQTQSYILGYSRSMQSRNGGSPSVPTATGGVGLAPPPGLAPVMPPSTPITGVVDPGTGATTTGTGGVASATTPTGSTVGVGRYFTNIATNLNASWELDFWGLFRRNLESANAVLDQSINNYDEMVVLLLANVAKAYVDYRTFQRRLELARANVAFQEPLVSVYRQRWKTGIANAEPGYRQLLSNLENTKSLIPALEISLREANNELCVLLGQPVHDLGPVLGDGSVPVGDSGRREVYIPRPREYEVVVSIPGDYLLRRPDVKAAEDQLRSQSAQIGIAEAEMLPHVGFNGTIGLASNHISTFIEGKSWAGNIGPSLSWNILNYGRLLANLRAQNDEFQQFVATYQQAILNANQDAENSLIAYLRSIDQAEHLKASADAATAATGYLRKQLREGYLPSTAGADTGAFVNQLFTLINFQVTQQDLAAQAEGNIALNLILLYRAMGGGWQIRLTDGHGGKCGYPVPEETTGTPPPEALPATPTEELPAPKKVSRAPKPRPSLKAHTDEDPEVVTASDAEPAVETPEPPPAVPAAPASAGVWYTAADGSKIYLVPPPGSGRGK
jgi:NodT family efflux transporter outer membrane factor (OMF) lipoprotein